MASTHHEGVSDPSYDAINRAIEYCVYPSEVVHVSNRACVSSVKYEASEETNHRQCYVKSFQSFASNVSLRIRGLGEREYSHPYEV